MNFITENLYTIILPLLILTLVALTYNVFILTKQKKASQKKLAVVYSSLESEKKLSESYKNNNSIIKSLEDKTQSKFLKIKVDLLNIDFTFQEIWKFI